MKMYRVHVVVDTLIHYAMDSLLLSNLSLTLLPQFDGDTNSCNTATAVRCCYCNKQRHRVLSHWSRMISNKGSGRVIVTRGSLSLSHTHTYGGGPEWERESEQGLIPAAGTCACVCVSKHLGRLPLHRPTGTSGSDSNNGSNAGGVGMGGGGAIRNARLVPASLSPLVRDTHNLRHRHRQDLSTAPPHYPVFLNPVGIILQTGHFSTRTLILSVCVLNQKIHEGVLLYLQKCILFC